MARRPENLLLLLSRVLGGKTFSAQLVQALEGLPGLRPHFVFLEEDDYGRHADKIPLVNRTADFLVGSEILKWKLRQAPPPACDAIFVQSFELLPACALLDARLPAVLAHDSTNVLSYRLIRDQAPSAAASLACWAKSLALRPFYTPLLRRVKAFLPRTRWCAESLVEDYGADPSRIRVAPAGIDTAAWSPGPPRVRAGLPTLLFVGDDFERKGGPFLLDVFRNHIHPRARLKVVSRHPSLRDPARALPEGVEVVSDLGPGRRDALLEEFRSADLFVFPTRKEHMGLVLTEAAAAGLPIIATGVGGTGEVVRNGENGCLMPYHATEGDWARAILGLLADDARRERFGKAGRALAEREFSREALRSNLEWAFGRIGMEERPVPSPWVELRETLEPGLSRD